MNSTATLTSRFIDAVHRRMVVIIVVEKVGLGLLFASLFAIPLLLIGICQAMPTLPILLSSGAFGLIGGVVLAIYCWPSRRSAAAEADHQLGLEDLLSTAMVLSNADEDFSRSILAMADARCARHSPSEVLFRRFGVGSWGAIAMAMSVAATLAVIPFGSSQSQAIDVDSVVLSAPSNQPHEADRTSVGFGSMAKSNDPISEGAANIPAPDAQPDKSPAGDPDAKPGEKTDHGSASGSGSGSSTTAAKAGALPAVSSTERSSDRNGFVGAGGAAATASDQNHENENRGRRAESSALMHAKPWISDSARPANGSENRTIFSTQDVPPEHRDLVRDFFGPR
jgi:hypothetical protein